MVKDRLGIFGLLLLTVLLTSNIALSQIPAPAWVNDGLGVDEDWTNSTTQLSANWAEVPNITGYQYAIGTSSGGTDVVSWTNVPATQRSVTRSGLSLSSGVTYYFTVRAVLSQPTGVRLGALRSSDGITVVTALPAPAWVNDGLGADKDWTNSTIQLSANWAPVTGVNPPVMGYSYAIGTSSGGQDVVSWTYIGNVTNYTKTVLHLTSGATYYFSVRARNTLGVEGTPLSSDGIRVDTNPPSSEVNPLPAAQRSLLFTVSWSGSDDLSGIKHYDVQYRDGVGGVWRDWLTSTTLISSTFTGEDGHTYYFRCRAQDNAGNQEAYPTTADTYTQIGMTAVTLNITPSPSSFIFLRDETSKDVTYILSLIGPLGVRINQEEVTYEEGDRTLRRETPIISEYISPGGRLELSRSITLDDTLRSLILAGRPSASFTLRRTFNGFDDRANPVNAESIISIEVRTTPGEIFEVTRIEIILPPGPFGQNEEVQGRIRFSTSGPPGNVVGNLYIDEAGWQSFGSSNIENGDEIETPPLPTGEEALGPHTLRVALTTPNTIEDSSTYEVTEAISIMERLTSLNVLKHENTPWAILENIEATATPVEENSDRYKLNGTGNLTITSLEDQIVPVEIENLEITFNSDDPPNSEIHSGSIIKDTEGTPYAYLFSLYYDFLHITRIKYQGGWNYLEIDVDLNLPVIDQKLYNLTGITVRHTGIQGKSFNEEHSFGLCGLEFRLRTARISGIEHPPVELGYRGGEIYASLSGEINLRRSGTPETITSFSGFRFGVNANTGEVIVEGAFSLADPFRFIPDNDYFNLTQLTFEFEESGSYTYSLRAEVGINLPEPLDRFGTQTANFRFTEDGNIEGDIDVIVEPSSQDRNEPELIDNDHDPTQISFWVCQLDLTYLGIELAFNGGSLSNSNSRVKVGADLWVEAKDGWLRQVLGTKDSPCFTVSFDGEYSWSLPFEISILQNKKIDLGVLWLEIDNLSITPAPFTLIISGSLGIDIEVCESNVNFYEFKVDLDGPKWETFSLGGDTENYFKVLEVLKITVGSIEWGEDPKPFDKAPDGVSATNRGAATPETISQYFRVANASINLGKGNGLFSGGFDELLIYEKENGKTKFAIKGVDIDIVGFNLLGDFEYRNPIISVAGGISGAGLLDLKVVGKVGKEQDGDLTFGIFVAADIPDVDIIPRLLVLTEVGGGFFYNPEEDDIQDIRGLCGVDYSELSAKAGSGNIPSDIPSPDPGSFAVLLYGEFYCVEETMVKGQALITLTGGYFSLDAHAEILPDQGHLATGALHFLVSWTPAFAEGGVWVDVDVLSLIEGTGYFEFYIFSREGEAIWAIMGGADLEVIKIVDIDTEFFIGPPGFMISGGIGVGLDLWIVSGGFSLEVMVWYERIPPDTTWGAYAEGRVWGEVLGGLGGASAGLYGALIMPPPELITGAYLSVTLLWKEVWSGNIWISVGAGGIDGGMGRCSRLDKILEEARNMADQMQEEMANTKDAIEEMQANLGSLDPKTRELLGTMLVGLESQVILPLLYLGEPRSTVCDWIMANILWDGRTEELFQIRTERDALFNSYKDGVSAIEPLQEQMMSILEDKLPELTALPTPGEQAEMLNPVRGMQYRTGALPSMDEEGNVVMRERRLKVGYDLDQGKADEQKEQMTQSKEDQQEYIRSVIERTEELKKLLGKTDELLYGRRMVETVGGELRFIGLMIGRPTLMKLSNNYTGAFDSLMNYYLKYFDYLDRAYSVSVAKQGELTLKETEIRTALSLQTQVHMLSLDTIKSLTRARRDKLMRLYNLAVARIGEEGKNINDLPEEERPTPPLSIDEDWDDDRWKTVCFNFGMDLWYEIPLAGYRKAASSISLLPVRADLYQRKMSFINAWADFTTHLDRVYDCRVRLYELLYDLYDELSTTYGAYSLPVKEEGIDIPSLNMIEFKEIILKRPSAELTPPGDRSSRSETGRDGGIIPSGRGISGNIVGPISQVTPEIIRFIKPGFTLPPGVTIPTFATYYGHRKDRIFTLLLPPEITSFSGESRGIASRVGSYAMLNCQFEATHPEEVVEYGLRIEQPDLLCEYENEFGIMTPDWFSLGNRVNSLKLLFVPGGTAHGEGRWLYLRARGPAGNYISRQGRFQVGYLSDSRSSINTTDFTPPCTPVVNDKGEWTSNSDRLYGSWESSDPESGIAEYQYRVIEGRRTTSGIREIRQIEPWTSAGAMKELNIRGLELENNKMYYIKVKAKNGAGRWSLVATSDGIKTDLVPPRITSFEFRQSEPETRESPSREGLGGRGLVPGAGIVETEPVVRTGPLRFYPNSLYAHFTAEDDESGVAEYSFRLLDEAGSELRVGTTTLTYLNLQDLPLSQGATYTLSLTARDNVSWVSEESTQEVTIQFEDTTAPPAPTPQYIPSFARNRTTRPDYIYSTSTVKILWDPVYDPESGIYEYQIGIGTTRETPDILPWTAIGRTTNYENDNLRMENGQSYYIMVKAINGADLESVGVLGPLFVDTTPPTKPKLELTEGGPSHQNIRIQSQDIDSGIHGYYYHFYRLEDGERTHIRSTFQGIAGTNELDTTLELGIEAGKGYQIEIKTEDCAGWRSELSSIEFEVSGITETPSSISIPEQPSVEPLPPQGRQPRQPGR